MEAALPLWSAVRIFLWRELGLTVGSRALGPNLRAYMHASCMSCFLTCEFLMLTQLPSDSSGSFSSFWPESFLTVYKGVIQLTIKLEHKRHYFYILSLLLSQKLSKSWGLHGHLDTRVWLGVSGQGIPTEIIWGTKECGGLDTRQCLIPNQ